MDDLLGHLIDRCRAHQAGMVLALIALSDSATDQHCAPFAPAEGFHDSALLASWFAEAGCTVSTVEHILFDADNGDRNGLDPHGNPTWNVYYYPPIADGGAPESNHG